MIQNAMSLNGRTVKGHERTGFFTEFYIEKINGITSATCVNDNTYNRNQKINADN